MEIKSSWKKTKNLKRIITTNGNNPIYTITLYNDHDNEPFGIKFIKLDFKKKWPTTVTVSIYLSEEEAEPTFSMEEFEHPRPKDYLGTLEFKTKEEVNILWMNPKESYQEKMKKLTKYASSGKSLVRKKRIPLYTIQMLIITHFPTNWLILLPEK